MKWKVKLNLLYIQMKNLIFYIIYKLYNLIFMIISYLNIPKEFH